MVKKGKLFKDFTFFPRVHITLQFLHILALLLILAGHCELAQRCVCLFCLAAAWARPIHPNPCAHFFKLSLGDPMGCSLCWHLQKLGASSRGQDMKISWERKWSWRGNEQKSWTILCCKCRGFLLLQATLRPQRVFLHHSLNICLGLLCWHAHFQDLRPGLIALKMISLCDSNKWKNGYWLMTLALLSPICKLYAYVACFDLWDHTHSPHILKDNINSSSEIKKRTNKQKKKHYFGWQTSSGLAVLENKPNWFST